MTASPGTILVTGAFGFVGRHLLPALAATFPSAHLATPRIDIQNADQVEDAVRTIAPDVCVHLAAVSAIAIAGQAPDHAWAVNFRGTMNLAWALSWHAPDCQMLFVSSADAYGASFKSGHPVDEHAPLAPMSVYGHTKAAADLALGGMAAQGLRVVRLRAFNHTGPGQTPDFAVPAFARQIARIAAGRQSPVLEVGNLETWRDFLDVRDVCAAYIACIASRDHLAPGTILNIASGQPRRIGDILTDLATQAGVDIEIKVDASRVRPTDIRMACGNPAQARATLHWAPAIPGRRPCMTCSTTGGSVSPPNRASGPIAGRSILFGRVHRPTKSKASGVPIAHSSIWLDRHCEKRSADASRRNGMIAGPPYPRIAMHVSPGLTAVQGLRGLPRLAQPFAERLDPPQPLQQLVIRRRRADPQERAHVIRCPVHRRDEMLLQQRQAHIFVGFKIRPPVVTFPRHPATFGNT